MEGGSFHIVELREAPEAVPQLARWHHAEWAHINRGDTRERRAERLRRQVRSAGLPQTWVAMAEEEVLGSASLVRSDMDTHPEWTPWLASVYVAEKNRGSGIGTALVRRVVEEAKVRGFTTLYLFTPDRPGFYERLDWARVGEESYRGERVTVMRRDLEPAAAP